MRRGGLGGPSWLISLAIAGWFAVPAIAKAGEPEIFTPVRIDLGLWTVVVFLILFFLLKKYAWGPMLSGLQKREENIYSALEEAQKAREEAKKLRDDLQARMDQVHDQVRQIVEEARRDGQYTREQLVAQGHREVQEERDRLRREIQMALDQALAELINHTADLAAYLSSKVIRRVLSPEDHRRLVDEALTELKHSGDDWQKQMAGARR